MSSGTKLFSRTNRNLTYFGRMDALWCDGKKGEELNPKNTRKTVMHRGGGVIVWGCMSATGVGNLLFIGEIMNKTVYMNILKQNLNQSAEKLNIRDNYYFQQDNDP